MENNVSRAKGWIAVLPALIIPVCLGMSMYLGLLAMIDRQVIADETILRYLTGHPISKVIMMMFLVGCGALIMIGMNLMGQFRGLKTIRFVSPDYSEAASDSGEDAANSNSELARTTDAAVAELTQQLVAMPTTRRDDYLWQRLYDGLLFVKRTGSKQGFEDELKYLADLDMERQQQRYSLLRILIWATPMLGFLGTVLGISQALGGIQVGPENDFSQMMGTLRGSLYVAFDTTALALSLSMLMMFAQFFVERFESQLLTQVDRQSRTDFSEFLPADATDGEYKELQASLLETTELLVERQAALWRKSIQAAENAWSESLTGVSEQVQGNLSSSLDHSVHCLSDYLGQAMRRADLSMSHRWNQWQTSLSENARTLKDYYVELGKQTQLLGKILEHSSVEQLAAKNFVSDGGSSVPSALTAREQEPGIEQVGALLGSLDMSSAPEPIVSHAQVDPRESCNVDTSDANAGNDGREEAGIESSDKELSGPKLQVATLDRDDSASRVEPKLAVRMGDKWSQFQQSILLDESTPDTVEMSGDVRPRLIKFPVQTEQVKKAA